MELDDLETLGRDSLGQWPQEQVAMRFIGWVVTPGGSVHDSQVEAELYVEDRVEYPIQWHDPFPDRDPSPTVFGCHPKVIEHWKLTGHLQPGRPSLPFHTEEEEREHKQRWEAIVNEIGDIAYDQWVISTEYEPVLGPVPDAILPHPFSRFFARESMGAWEVWAYSPFAKVTYFVRRASSRQEAVISAGLADYERQSQECGLAKSKRGRDWQAIKNPTLTIIALVAIVVGLAVLMP